MFRQLLDSEDPIILRQCFLALMATSKFYKRKQFLLLSSEEMKQFVTILRYAIGARAAWVALCLYWLSMRCANTIRVGRLPLACGVVQLYL